MTRYVSEKQRKALKTESDFRHSRMYRTARDLWLKEGDGEPEPAGDVSIDGKPEPSIDKPAPSIDVEPDDAVIRAAKRINELLERLLAEDPDFLRR